MGWWVQWLLLFAMWWGAFQHRRQLLTLVEARGGESRVHALRLPAALMSAREIGRIAGWARRKVSPAAPNAQRR
jgi:hypothetical protein